MIGRRKLLYRDGRPMRHGEIYAALGLDPKRGLPAAGLAPQRIEGIWVRVEAKIAGKAQDGERTRAECPVCNRSFGFARLRQHYVVHEGSEAGR